MFDEPTSSLTEEEVEHLFRIINMLRDRGCGIIYISHKMEEILRISDEVTVMRDGAWVATEPAAEMTMERIIKLMVGRELTNRFPPKDNEIGGVLLEVEGLTAMHSKLRDVSFNVHKGEIVGLAGLDGSGRTEVLENIFGVATRKKRSHPPARQRGEEPPCPRRDQKQVRAAHRGAARHGHLWHFGHSGEYHHLQLEEI